MSEARPPTIPQFSRRLAVETPEHVMLEFELAGLGSRAAAAIYDLAILVGVLLLVSFAVELAGILPEESRAWATAILLMTSAGIVWGYFFIFEGLCGGRTPGKRRLGIRVLMDTGHPITLQAAAVRNLLRLVDFQPAGAPLLALLMVFFHKHNKRLGDLAAGTIVVREGIHQTATVASVEQTPVVEAGAPLLSTGEFRLLGEFLGRKDSLDQVTRLRLAAKLRRRFSDVAHGEHGRAEDYLIWLHQREEAARRGIVPIARRSSGRQTTGSGQRFVALRRGAWESFRSRAEQLERGGLRSLVGRDVVRFAESYREVAADLARARTYRVDRRIVEYLERVVATGHNALYGSGRSTRASLAAVLLRRFPAAVIQGRAYVATATILFIMPAIVGFALIRESPNMVFDLMPPELIARAEAGSQMAALGRGYAETPSPYLPLVASSIVANNIQVAFGAFAFGIVAGVGTVVVLTFNGLFFGAVVGMFANYGLASWLLTFVAGHGVLELSAIFFAGAAGLLLGRAVVAPGDMLRRDALVVHGRVAVRLVGAAGSLLVLAGMIEGFLSASDAGAWLKLAVGGASVVLLVLYLIAGYMASCDAGPWHRKRPAVTLAKPLESIS